MENLAYVLRANGDRVDLDHRPTLEEAQKVVGGYVERVKILGGVVFVNEDGFALHLSDNLYASSLVRQHIVGDAVVLKGWRTLA